MLSILTVYFGLWNTQPAYTIYTTRFNRSDRILVYVLLLYVHSHRFDCVPDCEWPDQCTFFLFSHSCIPYDVAIHIRLARAVKPTECYGIFFPNHSLDQCVTSNLFIPFLCYNCIVDVPFLASMYLWMHSFGSSSFIPFVYWITNIENEIAKPRRRMRIRKRKPSEFTVHFYRVFFSQFFYPL